MKKSAAMHLKPELWTICYGKEVLVEALWGISCLIDNCKLACDGSFIVKYGYENTITNIPTRLTIITI